MIIEVSDGDILIAVLDITTFLSYIALEFESRLVVLAMDLIGNSEPVMGVSTYILHNEALFIFDFVIVIVIITNFVFFWRKYLTRNRGWL